MLNFFKSLKNNKLYLAFFIFIVNLTISSFYISYVFDIILILNLIIILYFLFIKEKNE